MNKLLLILTGLILVFPPSGLTMEIDWVATQTNQGLTLEAQPAMPEPEPPPVVFVIHGSLPAAPGLKAKSTKWAHIGQVWTQFIANSIQIASYFVKKGR